MYHILYSIVYCHSSALHHLNFKSISNISVQWPVLPIQGKPLAFTTLKWVCINHGDQRVFFNLKSTLILGNSMTSTSFVFTKLANTMKYGGGFSYNLVFTK